jgi:hypothetical protein
MKLEVGMYVRTKEGFIAKIEYIDEETGGIDCDSSVKTMYEEHYGCLWGNEVGKLVVKASHNIIDLIETRDYVNGLIVNDIVTDIDGTKTFNLLKQSSYFGNDEIKSIVTKEQFENMGYKVE